VDHPVIASVLVANRGEIARRVMRTARRMGIATVAVYSDADAGAPFVAEAGKAVRLGPPPARESYLRGEAIVAAAKETGAEAIHPGYGFLSENADFAEAVIAAGLVWIGPPPAAIRAMGTKDAAKRLMAEAGVPVTPGWLGDDQSPGNLAREAAKIGWPVLIKAVAGGGGKGMRKVEAADAFDAALAGARREAAAAFGDDRVLLEKYVDRPRHIEVQVFGDAHGDVIHLFERDCSIQRRHQKVIEEAPAPDMNGETRAALCEAAVRAARAVGYQGAGTIEFIADSSGGLRADRIWFMEMNTRLQVEHPVTEAITGLDLVEWQFRVASGEPLPLTQNEIAMSGHAIEARLYAEDPAAGFLPSVGRLRLFHLPGGVRVDSAVEAGGEVSPFYDPMIAKLVSHAPTRAEAAAALAAACGEVAVWPVRTNAWHLARVLRASRFLAGDIDTGFVEASDLGGRPIPGPAAVAAAASALAGPTGGGPWSGGLFGFRLGGAAAGEVRLYHDGKAFDFALAAPGPGAAEQARRVGEDLAVAFEAGAAFEFRLARDAAGVAAAGGDGAVRTPMPGRITLVSIQAGAEVAAGAPLITLEAMKMEHVLRAPFAGKVESVAVSEGQQVAEGLVAVRLAPA
jgi:acetyl/propionyl-CoA carboxylase alpha subunit